MFQPIIDTAVISAHGARRRTAADRWRSTAAMLMQRTARGRGAAAMLMLCAARGRGAAAVLEHTACACARGPT